MKLPVLKSYAILYLIFLYTPILILPIFAFNDSTTPAFPLKGFTTEWFGAAWSDPSLHKALTNSLIVAGSVSVISTLLGILAARATTRYSFRLAAPLSGLIKNNSW